MVVELTVTTGVALLTACPPPRDPLLPALLLSPEYVAVTESLAPTGSAVVIHVADPEDTADAEQPVLPLQLTVPVGLVPATVAVNTTDWPKADGFVAEVTETDVDNLLTVCAGLRVPIAP